MNWLTWQQHKKQFLVFGLILATFATLVIPTGWHFWDAYQKALLTCGSTNSCDHLNQVLFQSALDSSLLRAMKLALIAVPMLFGLFWGVPLIAREYNEGTNLLVWTRSVSRRKWLSVKLVWILTATATLTAAFSALATWWWRTGNALNLDRFQPVQFGVQGIVPVALAIFAVALGIALGTWLKRIMVALALTLGLLAAVQIIVPNFVRPHYMPATSYTTPLFTGGAGQGRPDEAPTPPHAGAAWIISGEIVNNQGQALDWDNPPESCRYNQQQVEAMAANGDRIRDGLIGRTKWMIRVDCLTAQGYTWHVFYQPEHRYWDFQFIEAALYLGLALIPLGATYWLVLRRDA